MTAVTLPDLADPATYDRGIPHGAFADLRATSGLVRNPDGPWGSGFWSVTRLDDLVAVSRDPQIFSSAVGQIQIYDVDEDVIDARASMIDLDPPIHTRLRRLVSSAFTPRHVQDYVGDVRRRIGERLDALEAAGGGDWVAEVAAPIPIGVICALMGVPEADHDLMIEMTDHLVEGTSSAELDSGAYGNTRPLRELPFNSPAAFGVEEYARRARRDRLINPSDDLLTHLAYAEVDGERLSETEYARFFQLMIFAGNETTRSAMAHFALHLVDHADQFDRVRSDEGLLEGAVEEVVRHASPILYFRRTATVDTVLAGTEVRAGDKVVMWYASANFDEAHFDDPLAFEVDRPRTPGHVAFGGGGAHFCLGASLARIELVELVAEAMRRNLEMRVVGEPEMISSNFVNGIESLTVELLGAR